MDWLDLSRVKYFVTAVAIIMAVLALIVRLKASRRPITVKRIIIPPLGMATGFGMFFVPDVHIPIYWGILAFLTGWFLFSFPLNRSTQFEIIDGEIFAKRTPEFAYILIGLLAIRLILHGVIEQYISVLQTASVFFLLAFGMILRWRLFMLKQYRRMTEQLPYS